MVELRNFVFDQETNINVDALEAFLNQNRDQIMESEEEFNIDLSTLMQYGPIETTDSKANKSTSVSDTSSQQISSTSQSQMASASATAPVASAMSSGPSALMSEDN